MHKVFYLVFRTECGCEQGDICQSSFKNEVVHLLHKKYMVYFVHSLVSKGNYLVPKVMALFLITSVWSKWVMTKALNV